MSSFLALLLADHPFLSQQDNWNVQELKQIADNVHDVRRRQADNVLRLQSDDTDEDSDEETDPIIDYPMVEE
jgi:hypothetical protein